MSALAAAVPDIAGEIVGWRAWRVEGTFRQAVLVSPSYEAVTWPGDAWFVAKCERDHAMPGDGCTCGIYAARDRAHLLGQGYNVPSGTEVVAIGEVGLAGKVICCDRGYRAERARPIRLWLPYEHWTLAAPLRARYGVPIGLSNTLKEELGHRD